MPFSKTLRNKQADDVITATLAGSDTACALGMTVTGPSPLLTLCRELIKVGIDSNLPLVAYRGPILCLRIGPIGAAAKLTPKANGVGFGPFRAGPQDRSSSPPIAPTAPAGTTYRARRETVS
jgi:hypothetical protein